jgi:SPP1 gp7 family putative phage head morphogenesis protein
VPDLDLPVLAARQGHQNPQRLIPVGATRAAELSLLKILLVPIRMVERALTEGKFLFSSIKEQLGDSIIEDAAPSRFHVKHKVRVRSPRGRHTPTRSVTGEPWWLSSTMEIEARDASLTLDTTWHFSFFMASLRQDLDRMSSMAEGQVAKVYADEERRLRRRLGANIRATFKVDPDHIWSQADVRDQLQVAVTKSVSLIKGLNDDLAKRVEFTILDAAQKGQSTTILSERLRKEMGISRDRARLIARDQVSSLNATLTKIRQKQVGIDQYVWQTAQDERVRHAHRLRQGKIFSWDDPPQDGHPGEPINCRCVAIALVKPKKK